MPCMMVIRRFIRLPFLLLIMEGPSCLLFAADRRYSPFSHAPGFLSQARHQRMPSWCLWAFSQSRWLWVPTSKNTHPGEQQQAGGNKSRRQHPFRFIGLTDAAAHRGNTHTNYNPCTPPTANCCALRVPPAHRPSILCCSSSQGSPGSLWCCHQHLNPCRQRLTAGAHLAPW